MTKIKNNVLRGDFYFRDVYHRNIFSSFGEGAYGDRSSVLVTNQDEAVPCTSQITTYADGVAGLHLFTRNQGNYDKSNTGSATVSVDALVTVFRSSRTRVSGEFVVAANVIAGNAQTGRVGIGTATPSYRLDVDGDCNVSGNLRIRGNAVISSQGEFSTSALSVAGNAAVGNVSTNAVSAAAVTASSVAVSGNASAGNLSVSGAFNVNGATWASSVVYSTNAAFTYYGPGASYGNGVSFYAQTASSGTAFVAASGTNNSSFTFATSGTYMLQAEVETGYPWFPEGDITTYFLKNGDPSARYGAESHGPQNLSCTRPYLFSALTGDNVRFIIDSSAGNDYEAGIQSARLTMLKLA